MVFTYLKVKSAKCLCLLPAVLVLVFLVYASAETCGHCRAASIHSRVDTTASPRAQCPQSDLLL